MNFRYPIFLDLAGKRCLVTGEGYEVAGKVQALVDAGAHVRYVNPRAEPSIEALEMAGLIEWEARPFEARDLTGCFLVIADLDNNTEIFRLAEEQRILCNAVDDPEHCRFSFGSRLDRGDLTIAIATNGIAPAIAVRLREKLAAEIGTEYGELLHLLKEVRPEIATRITSFDARRELWYRIADSEILALLRAGRNEDAEKMLRQMVDAAYK
jgi:precorrin-2 dehydrogenase/sirohydrochlorin ferrochelatase